MSSRADGDYSSRLKFTSILIRPCLVASSAPVVWWQHLQQTEWRLQYRVSHSIILSSHGAPALIPLLAIPESCGSSRSSGRKLNSLGIEGISCFPSLQPQGNSCSQLQEASFHDSERYGREKRGKITKYKFSFFFPKCQTGPVRLSSCLALYNADYSFKWKIARSRGWITMNGGGDSKLLDSLLREHKSKHLVIQRKLIPLF